MARVPLQYVVCFILISNLLPNLISDLISDFVTASTLNHTINLNFGNKIYGINNMVAILKFDIKSDIKFDISIKQSTWIGHKFISWLVIDYLFWRNTLISFSTWPDGSAQYTFTFVEQRWTLCELCDYPNGKVVLHISF